MPIFSIQKDVEFSGLVHFELLNFSKVQVHKDLGGGITELPGELPRFICI